MGGALHPEWDVHHHRYRPRWCRVLDYPLTADADTAAFADAPTLSALSPRMDRLFLSALRELGASRR